MVLRRFDYDVDDDDVGVGVYVGDLGGGLVVGDDDDGVGILGDDHVGGDGVGNSVVNDVDGRGGDGVSLMKLVAVLAVLLMICV